MKHNIIDTDNKLSISNIDLSNNALSYVDINSSLVTTLTALDANINTLTNTDVAQTLLNTQYTDQLTNHATTLATLQNYDIYVL